MKLFILTLEDVEELWPLFEWSASTAQPKIDYSIYSHGIPDIVVGVTDSM